MQNGTVTACSGIFSDSGGEFSNYMDNENFTLTICPDGPDKRVRLDFLEFFTQLNTDFLNIYDGEDTSALLFGSFSGLFSPGTIVATLDNPSGCLTVEFVSDSSGNSAGWIADISCTTPCQDITAVLDSTMPVPNAEGVIEVCIGDNINFNGSGIFEVDGSGAIYTWDLGNGNTASGQSVNVAYNTPGVYLVNLDIRDTNMDNFMDGCPNTNSINQIVRVSGSPDFSGTQAMDDTLCFGETTTIEGIVNPLTLFYNCPPPESETTFLPDGSGVAYSTCINVTCFAPDAVLTDVSQISDICMNIEHSFSGDLDIFIQSPNGQEVKLFDQAGGGIYFGSANDDNTLAPGIGENYCFSMSASTLLANAPTEINGTPPRDSWVPGTYLPFENFDTLLGSPLNGEWCITIIDNLFFDNGYIFSWELNFDQSVPQEDFEYNPAIISQAWDGDPSITEINGNVITVAPASAGEHCYYYRTIDEFGCEYTEAVCITVATEGQTPTTYYQDSDDDGYGDPDNTIQDCSNVPPVGYVINARDCNDLDRLINPDAEDSEGNNIDENCDGVDGNLLGLDDVKDVYIGLSPNPFKDRITLKVPNVLKGTNLSVSMYDISGRIIFEHVYSNIDEDVIVIVPNKLENSQYFLKLSNDFNGFETIRKVIKM